jgi:Sulfotransferase family
MGLVERLLPQAHFIHMIRDGRDVAVSIRPLWFGPNSIRTAAGWWRDTVERGRVAGHGLRHYTEVRFEDLVLETEPTLRSVCEFIELPSHPAMLAYHEHAAERIGEMRREGRGNRGELVATVAQRRAIHWATGDPPRPDRIGRWRHELSAWERRLFEWRCRELLASLGYL